jgi:hypothetical protein
VSYEYNPIEFVDFSGKSKKFKYSVFIHGVEMGQSGYCQSYDAAIASATKSAIRTLKGYIEELEADK